MDQLNEIIERIIQAYAIEYRDDLRQECWLKAWPLLSKFNSEKASLKTFLFRPLHGVCKRYLKKNVYDYKEKHIVVDNYQQFEALETA